MTKPSIALLADVGGTNARFVLLRNGHLDSAMTLDCASYPSLEETILAYLKSLGLTRVDKAAIAVAGPVVNQEVVLTNLGWKLTAANLAGVCGIDRLDDVWLLNDFHALALSLDHLPASDLRWLGGDSQGIASGNLAVIGPGTGLGTAGLVRDGLQTRAIVGEGGHMSASAANEREWHIIRHYFSTGLRHVSWERLISGSGLPGLHAAVCAVDGFKPQPLSAEQIGTHARNRSDESCVVTIDTFSAMLGSFAGSVALVFGATGGVFLAGGILPKLGTAFSVERFRASFTNKGRFEPYLAPINTYLIESPYPAFIGLNSLVGVSP